MLIKQYRSTAPQLSLAATARLTAGYQLLLLRDETVTTIVAEHRDRFALDPAPAQERMLRQLAAAGRGLTHAH